METSPEVRLEWSQDEQKPGSRLGVSSQVWNGPHFA